MNKTIFVNDNPSMSKPKEEFFKQLLSDLNGENKEFPEQGELFVTMLKKTSSGKMNTVATISNGITGLTQNFRYNRQELSDSVRKHSLEDKDNTGSPIRVGINSVSKALNLDWFKGIGFGFATEEDFVVTAIDRSPNKKNKIAKIFNGYLNGDTIHYSGNPEYKSGINGILVEAAMVPMKSVIVELPANEKSTITISTPQLIDGKYLLKHVVLGDISDKDLVDTVDISYADDNRIVMTVNTATGESKTKEVIIPPSNPLQLNIKIGYPKGNRLVGKKVKFVEDTSITEGVLTTNLKQLKLPKQIANILKNDPVLSKISHDFFVVEAKESRFINLKLEDRTDWRGEKFARSFYIGDKKNFNHGFYNLVSGVESDEKLFKVFTRDDKLTILYKGKPYILNIGKTKGYGVNIDLENKAVIFNTDFNFNNVEEMYEDLTANKDHIKVFPLDAIGELENPFLLLMEAEDTSKDTPPVSLLYRIEEEPFQLETNWESAEFVVNKINIPDPNNPFVTDTAKVKDTIVIKPALTRNVELDEDLQISVPEEYSTERFYAYQVSLPENTKLKMSNLLNLPVQESLISIHPKVRNMSELGIFNRINMFDLADHTKLEVAFPLIGQKDVQSDEFILERKDKHLFVHTPDNGILEYRLDTDETMYVGHFLVTLNNNGKEIFKSAGVSYE